MSRRLIASLCAGLALAPASAAAASAPKLLNRDVTFLTSDGSRFVFYKTNAVTVVVRDDAKRTVRRVGVPAACAPLAASRGIALLDCQDQPPVDRPVLLDGRTGNLAPVDFSSRPGCPYLEIGRHWLRGISCARCCASVYLNWRTGEYRANVRSGRVRDLDTPGLAPRGTESADWLRFGPRRPGPDQLVLVHRGRPRVISECPVYCDSPSAGGGVATWAEGLRVKRYTVSSRRLLTRTLKPRAFPRSGVRDLVHTRARTYVRVSSGANRRGPDRLYRLDY